MKKLVFVLVMMLTTGFPLFLVTPQDAAAHDCACLDGNGDDLCGNVADTPVADDDWLKGPLVGFGGNFPGSTFVVPTGCNHTVGTAPKGGIRVTAARVVFDGELLSTPNGGEGVLFTADNACVVSSGAEIVSGGVNKLLPGVAGNEAIAKSSVAFKCGTTCDITGATLRSTDGTLFASGKVGIQCGDDIRICGSTIRAAGVNIQSSNGKIDASVGGAGGPAGIACDDPVQNLVNGPASPGDGDGTLENTADDFPCQIQFNNQGDIATFCGPVDPCGPNTIEARNNPLIMISKLDLDLSGQAGSENRLTGVFRVTLAAEDGNIDTSHTFINNGPNPPGGAKIWLFADPTGVPNDVIRLPVDHEDFFGPSSGTTDIASACYESPNPVQVGDDTNPPALPVPVIGVPDGVPCKQNDGTGFVPVLNGNF